MKMLALENADEILQILDRFTKQKSKDIPPELEEYINYVAKTGDTVYRWPTVQYLFREKLRNVIKDFHDTTASIEDLPQCPNVDQFNYDSMKTLLFERFDCFQAAPFTIQRLCELLTDPKKHYSRLDKFMRALEKNILVVSTVEPGRKSIQNNDTAEIDAFNNDVLNDINIDIEINKNDEKQSNGKDIKHIEFNSTEHMDENVASSSSSTSSSSSPSSSSSQASPDIEMKKDESTKDDAIVSEKSIALENVAENSAQISIEATDTPMTTEPIGTKPDDTNEKETIEKENDVIPKSEDQLKPNVTVEKIEPVKSNVQDENDIEIAQKAEKIVEDKPAAINEEEKKNGEDNKETITTADIKPSTPKHARSSSDDEEELDGDSNKLAKKIRLDFDDDKKKDEKNVPELENSSGTEPVVSKVDSEKETDILESITTEIDAQKENELLEDVVDSVLVTTEKDPVDIQPIAKNIEQIDSKPIEELPATDDLLKTDEPVSIPSDLDFTPDEALNELVSSDILAVIPEQQTVEEEIKMSDETNNIVEPAVQATDEMNVENTDANAIEAENAMESAPIKVDEEKMDVDESNSVDAMDL